MPRVTSVSPPYRDRVRYRLLGPVEPALSSRNQRLLLTMLLLNANRTVSGSALIDELWPEDLPSDPEAALRTQVSRLRRRLGADINHVGEGYRLSVSPEEVDVFVFERLLEDGRVDEALALWNGCALEEFADRPFAEADAVRLDELRNVARERRAEALVADGRCADAVADLEALLAEHPERERARALLMRSLYREGRHTDALAAYESWRRYLADELGLEPSPELKQLESEILRHALPSRRTALPAPVSTFLGRAHEMEQVAALLGQARIVTLCGPGGVGKTRLALEVARAAGDRYENGAHLCDLSAVRRPGQVAPAVASALAMTERAAERLPDQIAAYLASRRLLLVLDNCEHVLPAAAGLVDHVVRRASGVDVLATSRQRLGVDGEHRYVVPPLARETAVELFRDRARATGAGVDADDDALAAICERLDDLPLAIELAAARAPGLTVTELSDVLDERFQVLVTGSAANRRHRSLSAVVDWSYQQLTRREREVFETLSVFAGRFDMDAACAMGASRDVVLRLVDRSMVTPQTGRGKTRYSLLETLREYGRERLEAGGTLAAARAQHAGWARDLAHRAARGLASAEEGRWAEALTESFDELRAAHGWLVGCDTEAALDMSNDLHGFAFWRTESEVFRWADVAVAAAGDTAPELRAAVAASAAAGAWQRGDLDAAEAGANAARDHRRAPEVLGDVALMRGNLEVAAHLFEEAAGKAVDDGDLVQAVWDRVGSVVAHVYAGRSPGAVPDETLELARDCGSPSALAIAHFARGEATGNAEDLRLALELAASVGSRLVGGIAEVSLAALHARERDAATALRHYQSVIEAWYDAGVWAPQWVTMRTLTDLLADLGVTDEAAILYGATAFSRGGAPPYGADAALLDRVAKRLRDDLGDQSFTSRVDEGAAMTDEEVVEVALRAVARAGRAAGDGTSWQ